MSDVKYESTLPPNMVFVGLRHVSCPGCGAVSEHRGISVPGDPGTGVEREVYRYALCDGCETLHYDDRSTDGDELYGAHYYSHSDGGVSNLKRQIWRVRNALTLYAPSPLSDGLIRFSEHRVLPRLRPILRGDFGRRIGRRARWLDIGCGGGSLLADLKAIGFTDLTGADPFMVQERQEPGFRLLRSDGVSLQERFDVVMMHHSLEHVGDPNEILRGIHSVLAPGGVALIRIPISASYPWRHYGGEWINLDAPRHMTLFSRAGFEMAAARAGWTVRRTTYDAAARTLYASEARIRGYCERTSNVRDLFTPKELAEWDRRSWALRRNGGSDEASFYLTTP